jgi:hypothetical protein
MLAAQLKGKLTRKEEDLEDLLTSNVFGSIQYTPNEKGLIPLLSAAEDSIGKNPLKILPNISDVTYEFWPYLDDENGNAREPDVLIHITHETKQQTIILVEAKYKSGKSSEADEGSRINDQLASEWDILITKYPDAKPYLLYVTADFSYPNKDIKDSQSEFAKKSHGRFDVVWISWRKLPTVLNSNDPILKDLIKVLRKQGLTFFEGIKIPAIDRIPWTFKENTLYFNWKLNSPEFDWWYAA